MISPKTRAAAIGLSAATVLVLLAAGPSNVARAQDPCGLYETDIKRKSEDEQFFVEAIKKVKEMKAEVVRKIETYEKLKQQVRTEVGEEASANVEALLSKIRKQRDELDGRIDRFNENRHVLHGRVEQLKGELKECRRKQERDRKNLEEALGQLGVKEQELRDTLGGAERDFFLPSAPPPSAPPPKPTQTTPRPPATPPPKPPPSKPPTTFRLPEPPAPPPAIPCRLRPGDPACR